MWCSTCCVVEIGGFVWKNQGTVSSCYATVTTEIAEGFSNVEFGGFACLNENEINNCHASIDVTADSTANQGDSLGGFVGTNSAIVTNCYVVGKIDTVTIGYKGGFVGMNASGGTINKSFCDVNMLTNDATLIGYFVGNPADGSTLFKCYYNDEMVVRTSTELITPPVVGGTATTVGNLQSRAFLFETLSWSDTEWKTVQLDYPKLIWQD